MRGEIVLAMSLLQMSWPFGAMLALPIQAYVAQLGGWPAVMLSSARLRRTPCFAPSRWFRSGSSRCSRRRSTAPDFPLPSCFRSRSPGVIWGGMNLACILFFSYAPAESCRAGIDATVAASLTSLAIWFTILAIPAGGYLVHRSGKPIAAIVGCALVAAVALGLFVAGVFPIMACLFVRDCGRPDVGSDPVAAVKGASVRSSGRSGFGVFYTCFYVLMAVGPLVVGHLQGAFGDRPSVGLIGGSRFARRDSALVSLLHISVEAAAPSRARPQCGAARGLVSDRRGPLALTP